MDYLGILKKAWNITWRYKALWILGLFAGAGLGSSGGSSSSRSSGTGSSSRTSADQFSRLWSSVGDWATGERLVLILVIVGALALLGLLFFILSIAAQGGLVSAANEAAEDRKPSISRAWGVGFSRWGRTFMTGFVLGLPFVLVIGALIALLAAAGAGAYFSSGSDSAAAAALGSMCLLIPLVLVLLIGLGLVVGIVYQLALRYGILEDRTFGHAIAQAWRDLWGKRGAFVFWLVMILPGMAAGFAFLIIALILIVPVAALFALKAYVVAVVVAVPAILLLAVPQAIWATFSSAAWTVFFRRMTGVEPGGLTSVAYQPADYTPPAPPAGYPPPTPPAPPASYAPQVSPEGYAPPAPPAGYAPPAPPVALETPPAPPVVDVVPEAGEAPPTDE